MCPPSWTRWKAKQHADGPWEQRAGGPGSRPAAGAEATGTAEHLPWGTQPTLYFCQLSPCQKVGPAVDSLTQEVRNLDLLYTTPFRETTGWMTASCLSWAFPMEKPTHLGTCMPTLTWSGSLQCLSSHRPLVPYSENHLLPFGSCSIASLSLVP